MREIFVTSDVTQEMATDIVFMLKRMAEGPESLLPIKMYINSYGGSAAAMFTILDAMRTCPCEIITVNLGDADSAASLIFSAGTKRFITENSRIMLHEIRLSTIYTLEPISKIEAEIKEFQIMNENMFKALSKNTGKSAEEIKNDVFGKDLYLSAQEAIDYGLADEILTVELKEKYSLKKAEEKAGNSGKRPQNQRSKLMTKEEMLTALKDSHGVDVAALKSNLEKANAEAVALKAEKEALEASKKDADTQISALKTDMAKREEALEAVKKEQAFEKIVASGKEAVACKEEVLKIFKTAAEMEASYKNRPAVFNTKPQGSNGAAETSEIKDEATLLAIKEGYISDADAKKYLKKEGK